MKRIRALVLYANTSDATLSYHLGWPLAFQNSPEFEARLVNISKINECVQGAFSTAGWNKVDIVVMLHSVFSNSLMLGRVMRQWLRHSSVPKVFFIGNEYKNMPEKLEFARRVRVSLFVTQCNSPKVISLYEEALGCPVVSIPNTGFFEEVFYPSKDTLAREIAIGYRGYEQPIYFGHNERVEIVEGFAARLRDLKFRIGSDLSLTPEDRFDSIGWAAFLNRYRGQLGTEAGGDYFELTDRTRKAVIQFLVTNPKPSLTEVFERFFADYVNPIPLRIISGRQIEAAACKTVQILFKGHYSGYLAPDEHYIQLEKDFSNFQEVISKFLDDAYCLRLANNAYDLAHSEFTYDKLTRKCADTFRQHVM